MLSSKAIAIKAHAMWTVERKQLRAGWLVTPVAMSAGIVRRQQQIFGCFSNILGRRASGRSVTIRGLDGHDQTALGQRQRLIDGFRKTRTDLVIVFQTIYDDFNVMFNAPIEPEIVGQANDTAIDP